MKNFYRSLFLLVLLVTGFAMHAQQDSVLKNMINKNNFAIRSIQKHCILTPQFFETAAIKELLKFQVISVELYNSENKKCKASAYQLRKKCLEFINSHNPKQLAVYNLTTNELTYFSDCSDLKNPDSYLDKKLLKSIDAVDEKNPYLFNDFNLTIK